MTRPDDARLKLTAKSSVGSLPSRARASATESATGPRTVADTVPDSALPSAVHTAAGVSQAAPPASVTVTAASESGLTVSFHRSLRLFTRPAFVARPPDTATTSDRNRRPLILISSLNAILSLNAFPSCSDGMSTNDAVSAGPAVSTSGPATVAAGVLASCLRFSPLVQIAPDTAHSRPASSVTVTAPPPSGSTVISNRSRRSSTRSPRVTRPPLTANASSRRLR